MCQDTCARSIQTWRLLARKRAIGLQAQQLPTTVPGVDKGVNLSEMGLGARPQRVVEGAEGQAVLAHALDAKEDRIAAQREHQPVVLDRRAARQQHPPACRVVA